MLRLRTLLYNAMETLDTLTLPESEELNRQFATLPTDQILAWAWNKYGKKAAIGTSFQSTGLVMIDLARKNGMDFPVFTLDTGLLFLETIALKNRLEDFFKIEIENIVPDLDLKQQEAAYGPELWKRDPDMCCTVRKVLPLQSKLSELNCWITGLRRQQSQTRSNIDVVEVYTFDESTGREIIKLNPMANWSRETVWHYIRDNKIPYNPLQDQGYRSIGCAPCTRKADGKENERAGRWTGFNKVECGIHTFMARKG